MRRLAVASAILATLLTTPLSLAAALPTTAAPTDATRATAALSFLRSVQLPDGSLAHSIGATSDFVIGAAAAGYDPATLVTCKHTASALGYIAISSDAAAGDAAKTGKAILAVVAAGLDPTGFEGRDLLARLTSLYHSGTGAYHDGSTYSQSFAMLALKAAGSPVPAEAVAELKALQDPDGSWSYGTAPVPAGQGDTNSTAIAVMALDAAGDNSAEAAALAYLRTQQLADGGFPYQNPSSFSATVSDPDSDAGVIEALASAGQDPEGTTWLQGGNSALTHLRSGQASNGGFAFPGGSPDAFTTSQVPAALVRIPYGSPVHWTAGRTPEFQCIADPATVTPPPIYEPTPKPTVRPTARPTVRPTASPTEPADTPEPTPATPTATPTEALVAAAATGPTEQVAGITFTPADSNPTPSDPAPSSVLLYGVVAAMGLVVVLGGGWLYITRPWTR
jgi:cell division septation protein DedD